MYRENKKKGTLGRATLDPSKVPFFSASPNSSMEFVMGNVQKIHKVDVIDYSKAAKIICSPTGNY